jgi:adenylate cyclase
MRPKSASKKNTKKATSLPKQKASQKSKPISKSSKIKRKTSARTKADKEPILEGSWENAEIEESDYPSSYEDTTYPESTRDQSSSFSDYVISEDKESKSKRSWLKNLFYNSSIRLKLVFIISMIIILSISSIIYIATFFFRNDNELRIKEKNLEITELIASKTRADISNLIRSAKLAAISLAQGTVINLADKSEIKELNDLSNEEGFIAIYIYIMEGGRPTIFQKSYNPIFLTEKNWNKSVLDKAVSKDLKNYTASYKGKTVVLNSSINKEPLIAVSYPYKMDEASGFIIALAKMDSILSSFKSSGITDNFMLTQEGIVLAHSKKEDVYNKTSFKELPIYEKIQDSPINNGQIKFENSNKEVFLASFKKLGLGNLTVVTSVPEEKAMEEVNNIQRRNFYLMIIILNVSILIVFIYSKSLTKPILSLVEASKKIERGEFQLDIKETSGDEIGVLTRSFVHMGKGLSERDKIKDAFGKFVSPELAEKALHGNMRLGGERKECTIFFSDIRNFTAMSETMQPEDVVDFLNLYMTEMVSCVNQKAGIVDKFIGDSIMAVWGAISSTDNDTESAIETALLMRKSLAAFNKNRGTQKKPFIRIGIGINTGDVIAGQIGSEERLEFTVIGDAVNLASRVEGLNKEFGTDILITESAYSKVPNLYNVKKMKAIQVKGKKKAQVIFAVLGRLNDSSAPKSIPELRSIIYQDGKNSSGAKAKT